MQLVKAPRDALLRPLQVVNGIVERRQTLPILANVLLRRDGERLSFMATDLEIQIQTSADLCSGKDSAATTVSARKLLDMVHFAMAAQDIRYYLNGMLLVCEGNRVRAVATDGHRLALCETARESESATVEAIIPRKTVLELARLLPDSDEPVRVQMASGQVRLSFGAVEFVSKLVEGKFPDYTKVIPAAT